MLDVRELRLEGLFEIRPRRFEDERGFFSETFNSEAMAEAGLSLAFVQDNHSLSRATGTIRGLHFQSAPAAQDKLVRVSRGAIWDVAVDLRKSSSTYGQWEGVVLSASEWNQLLVPRGFAHGFQTLEEDTEVQYKVTCGYSPAHDRVIRFDDPRIAIEWPVAVDVENLSLKDRNGPLLAQIEEDLEF